MIRDCNEPREFEKRYWREAKTDYKQNIRIYGAMYKYAGTMFAGRYNINLLEGIELKINIARVINSV
jgi:hypothetical protein